MKYQSYPKYKDSGVEWLGEVPEHWIALKVGRDMPFMVGWTPSTSNESYYENGEYPWVSIEDMKGKYVSKTKKKLTKKAILEKHAKPVPKGSILFSFKLSVGKVAFAKNDLYTNEAIASFLPSKNISSAFFYYLAPLFIPKYGRNNLYDALLMNQELISSAKTLVPLYEEQILIANFLDHETTRIDSLIKEKENFISLLKEKRQALISHAVTKGLDPNVKMKDSGIEWLGDVPEHWGVLQLRRVVKNIKTGGTPNGATENHFDENGFNWFTPSDFDDDFYLSNSNRKLSVKGKDEVNIFPEKTVMLIGIGATIGKVGISEYVCSCNQQINAIICSKTLNPYYCNYFLNSNKEYIISRGKFTTLPIINQDETKSLVISLPSIKEQLSIVKFLNCEIPKIDSLVKETKNSIELLKEHRTALISAAVTGKIDVRNFKKEVA